MMMRLFVRSSLLVLALASASPAAAQAADAEDAAPEVSVAVRPTGAHMQRSIQFDDEGMPQGREASLSLQFVAEVTTELKVIGARSPQFTSITSSLGEALALPAQRQQPYRRELQQRKGPGGPGSLTFTLPLSDPPTLHGIGEASGTVTLFVADGPRREVRLVPLERYLGRTAVVEDIDFAEVEVRPARHGRIEVLFSDALTSRFVGLGYAKRGEAAFFDADGTRINLNANGRRGLSMDESRVPEGGGVVLRVYPQLREVEVAWTCGPFELPSPGGAAVRHLAVRTVDEGEAPAAEGGVRPEAKGAEGPLPLRIGDQVQPMDG